MTNRKEEGPAEAAGRIEWRIRVDGGGSTQTLVPDLTPAAKVWLSLKGLIVGWVLKVRGFLSRAWDMGVDDPRKVVHCLKVGIALSTVSLFYYMRPLYEGVGGTAMWAVMTVVVVFEYTVGATVCKCLNRATGTFLAGFLALGVHWVASQSGHRFEPIIMGAAVFLLATAATFSRFIPTVKARFDYGTMIFILTFSLVAVSGYRVDKLIEMARERLSTIIIGTSLCVITSMLIFPIWAGQELHLLITRNMDKIADSLDCCVTEYFDENEDASTSSERCNKNVLQGYRCALNSKATEESMANFARWEPAHGHFAFGHPWKQYLKIGASLRGCACCIEALCSCINTETQASDPVKKHLRNTCFAMISNSSSVLRELSQNIKTMKRLPKLDIFIDEMKNSVQDLQNDLKSLPDLILISPSVPPEAETSETEKKQQTLGVPVSPLVQAIPLVTFASLLIEISSRIEGVAEEVEELANLAEFEDKIEEKLQNVV